MSEEKEKIYVVVDRGICVACGSCQAWSPDVFAYDPLSLAYNRLDDNTGTVPIPDVVVDDVLPTKFLCPTKAIKIGNKPWFDFQETREFGTESPDNPNINYELKANEVTVNEINADTAPKDYEQGMPAKQKQQTGFEENLDPEDESPQ